MIGLLARKSFRVVGNFYLTGRLWNGSPRPFPPTINDRVAVVERAIRSEFPDALPDRPRFHQAFLNHFALCSSDPSMSLSTIQATVDAVASEQVSNQFGTQRYALLFEPGTYGSSATPLIFQVGYYTTVAGLGLSPSDVTINGEINVSNQCFGPGNCTALLNFWRSLSNLTINVTSTSNCTASAEFWAVSQAAPIRRAQINGNLFLFDYCSGPGFASGGFIADSQFTSGTIIIDVCINNAMLSAKKGERSD
jgi:hypothetical protein